MNQTKIQVPRIAVAKAKMARLHRVEAGINRSASKMPNWAEEMVAPVVGDTNLLLHSCCMMSPATLMPMPVHKMASRRGSREMMKISSCSKLPARSSPGVRSITPTNSEQQDKTSNRAKRTMVERYGLIQSSPFFHAVSYG